MFDAFALVSHADPPSIALWAVFVFSAAMYPLGIMLGAPCSPCCAQSCTCGDYRNYPYEQQTASFAMGGRWCCNGTKPYELTLRVTSTGTQTVSFDQAFGNNNGQYWTLSTSSWLPYESYSSQTYLRMLRRTINFNCNTLNADYVVRLEGLPYLSSQTNAINSGCGYVGASSATWLYPGTSRRAVDTETFPSYTISLDVGAFLGNGSVSKQYYKKQCSYLGFYQYNCPGDFVTDSVGGQTSTNPAYFYFGGSKKQKMLAQACDLRSIPSGAIDGGAASLSFAFANIFAATSYSSTPNGDYFSLVEEFTGNYAQDGKWPKCTFTVEVLPP